MIIHYYFFRFLSKITHNHRYMIDYYRRGGVKIGDNCLICSNILTREACLISIGSNVTISTNVSFITHDNSIKLVINDKSDLFGKISIGNNCFIGENSSILYGVTLANNIIVAAGSVVTKSFYENNIIIGGNPAKKIGDWETFREKYKDKAVNRRDVVLSYNESFLVDR